MKSTKDFFPVFSIKLLLKFIFWSLKNVYDIEGNGSSTSSTVINGSSTFSTIQY